VVKFTVRLKKAMYDKVKNFAKDEGITLMAALRNIINCFFKEKA